MSLVIIGSTAPFAAAENHTPGSHERVYRGVGDVTWAGQEYQGLCESLYPSSPSPSTVANLTVRLLVVAGHVDDGELSSTGVLAAPYTDESCFSVLEENMTLRGHK